MIRERVVSTKEAKKDTEASFIDLTICFLDIYYFHNIHLLPAITENK